MVKTTKNKWHNLNNPLSDNLSTWLNAFLKDRIAQGLAPGTMHYYKTKLSLFADFCESKQIIQVTRITASDLREYMLLLEEKGHNPGGRHGCYRTVKTFLYWWEQEVEPDGWSNPVRKVKPPKLPIELLDPVSVNDIEAMVETCDKSFHGRRDKAILLGLLDSGARANEFLDIKLDDYNKFSGEILIRHGNGRKPRTVFLGKITRRAVRGYLNNRKAKSDDLWITNSGEQLTYFGLREIIRRRAKLANIEPPAIHSFRRAFAINMLRAGVDVFSLQKLMGHSDLQILRRYLAQTKDDIALAHSIGSPVDNCKLIK
jgi:site-specific recombinase XerD